MFNGNFLKNCVKVLYLMKIIEMKLKYLIGLIFITLLSCSPNKNITGNYYCTCYFDFYPFSVIKIKNKKFELYSANIMGSKYLGRSEVNGDVLYLYRTHDLNNNFKDSLVSIDTSKYVIKGRKLIPFKNEKCFYLKTNNKDKLFQMPYFEIDTTR